MATLTITYDTEPSPTVPYWTWGRPEDDVHNALSDSGAVISEYDAGTDLWTGRRDVRIVTDAPTNAVHVLLAPFDHAAHWTVTA